MSGNDQQQEYLVVVSTSTGSQVQLIINGEGEGKYRKGRRGSARMAWGQRRSGEQ